VITNSSDQLPYTPKATLHSLRTAVVYVTDVNFSLPTAASALAMIERVSKSLADIYIIAVDFPTALFQKYAQILECRSIYIRSLSSETYMTFDLDLYNRTHVPPTALARFFLVDVLPHGYHNILYLDGDVFPNARLDDLLTQSIPTACIAAAEDKSHYYRNEMGPAGQRTRAYFGAIGVGSGAGYFNSGVIFSGTETWRKISEQAFDYFIRNVSKCRFHDQSALNAVAASRRVSLSPLWNFLSSYYEWGIAPLSKAKLIHFAGGFKPWQFPHSFYPGLYEIYQNSFSYFREAGFPMGSCSADDATAEIRRARRYQLKMNSFLAHRKFKRWVEFNRLCKSAVVA
jgi:lipopolysaccharide biosynthesis glycosyltransferase